jgi:hypothetical protein
MRSALVRGAAAVGIASAVLGAGCADEFEPYDVVAGHRLLGVRATPPEIRPGDTAVIDALVTSESASYAWSWCPLPFADPLEGACALSEEELRALLQAAGEDSPPPPYDLGSEAEASFEHTFSPELLEGLCEALRDQPLPPGVSRPRCRGRFSIALRLVVASDDEEIAAVRELGLVYADDYEPNTNPRIESARIGVPYFELGGDEAVLVGRGFRYLLELDVSDSAAEVYETLEDGEIVERRESLVVSWFREGGEMEKVRSSFLEGTTDFDNLTTNHWIAPSDAELERDQLRLYFVLRDNRGGIDWLAADMELLP